MIFNASNELFLYLKKLTDSDTKVSLSHLNKMLELNSITIERTILVEGSSDEILLKSIKENEEGKIELTLYSPSWIKMLPSLYHDNLFLQKFLFGFQVSDLKHQNTINSIEEQFNPSTTKFIDWLSTWVGIRFAAEVSTRAKRRILHNIVNLYKIRGTKSYFIELVEYLAEVKVSIEDSAQSETLHGSLIRRNSQKSNAFFKVIINEKLSENTDEEQVKLQMIYDILDSEKPINVNFKIEYPFGKTDTQSRDSKVVDMHYENYYDYDNIRDKDYE
jgi:phage tail-like protein